MTGNPIHTAVERAVLKRITPPAKQPLIIKSTMAKVQAALNKKQIQATVVLGGSLAKGTYLAGDHDVDVFVRFAESYKDGELADILERMLKTSFAKVERVHGSRDYFHAFVEKYLFEFIPVLNIATWQEARNVTDMSPLHVQYVTDHVRQRPWLAGEIRMTKQFCKAAKVYGAESYIGGFSGHVIDLLNIHYGGFHKLLEAASSWPAKVVIDPSGHFTNPLTQLNNAKTIAPLVIVDPIQKDRNSSAALSQEAYKRFRITAKEYLQAKDQSAFFIRKPLTAQIFQSDYPNMRIFTIAIKPLKGKKDVVGAKCYKAYHYCVQQLIEHDFVLRGSAWEFSEEKTSLFFALAKEQLPADVALAGPPVHMTQAVAKFMQLHKDTFTKEKRIYAVEKRKYRDPKLLLQKLLTDKYLLERVAKASLSELPSKRQQKVIKGSRQRNET